MSEKKGGSLDGMTERNANQERQDDADRKSSGTPTFDEASETVRKNTRDEHDRAKEP